MPRLIDHDARATEVTEAAWRVLVRGGVPAVSVRNVAAEAGIATASLRRAFPTQADLLTGCLALMSERVTARVRALPQTGTDLDQAMALLAEVVPLDDVRRVEMEVYLALGAAAMADDQLAPAFAQVREGLHQLCSLVVTGLRPGAADEGRQVAHLAALVDGLALGVLHGDDPVGAMAVLRDHLSWLAGAASAQTAQLAQEAGRGQGRGAARTARLAQRGQGRRR